MRKRIMTVMLLLFALLLGLCLWVIQPIAPQRIHPGTPDADKQRLRENVEMLTTNFGQRDAYHPNNLDRVADYIREQFSQSSVKVTEQTWKVGAETYRNVSAVFGKGDRLRIIIGAHYDTWFGYPGADDNASGVASILELSRLLQTERLKHDVELVAYSVEEPPFFRTPSMGSAVHAAELKKKRIPVLIMISVEMVGYFDDAPGSQTYPIPLLKLFYPSTANYMAVVGKMSNGLTVRKVKRLMQQASALPFYSMNGPRSIPGIDFSDHLNYWANGYDAVMITDTAFYRNPHYHTPTDTADTLDYERLAMVVKGLFRVASEFQ